MNILTSAVLDHTYNLPVLFFINLFNFLKDDICLTTCWHTLFIVCALFFKLRENCENSAIYTIVLRKHYHPTRLNKIRYGFPSTCLNIKTLKIMFNLSVLIICLWNTLHAKIKYKMNVSHFNCLRLDFCQRPRILSHDISQ